MKTILLDAPRFYYVKHNTDILLRQIFACQMSDAISLPTGVIWSLVYNILSLTGRVIRRRWINVCASRIRSVFLEWYKPNVVIYQGIAPVLSKRYKTVWETYYLDETDGCKKIPNFSRDCSDRWVFAMRKYGSKVGAIGVRGGRSVALLKAHFPEFAGKVFDLGFVKPEYEIASEEETLRKHRSPEEVNVLFVGREAKRKGLDLVLDACSKLHSDGIRRFRLTIVSNLLNANFTIPNEDWITWHRSLPHEDVIGLMKNAHVFIMPSRFESYGLVYQEAMAEGCCVCVRNGEPQMEFVDYGKAGVVVDVGSADDIAKKLRQVILEDQLRSSLAIAGLRRYKNNYSQEVIRKQWRTVLDKLNS